MAIQPLMKQRGSAHHVKASASDPVVQALLAITGLFRMFLVTAIIEMTWRLA